jgi:hypothetical protein
VYCTLSLAPQDVLSRLRGLDTVSSCVIRAGGAARKDAMKKFFVTCLLLAMAGCGLMCWMLWVMDAPITPDIQTQTEIAELQAAVDAFQKDSRVSYIPSRIKLSETGNYPQRDQPNTLDFDSIQYLHKLWPKLDVAPGCRFDWNGDGRVEGDGTLEGAPGGATFPQTTSRRLHSAISYVTPQDKLQRRDKAILAARDRKLEAARERKKAIRQAALLAAVADQSAVFIT